MSEPTIEGDVEVPLRLQPVVARSDGWRGLSVNLIAVGLIGFVVIGVLLGTAFDRGGPSSSVAAVIPSASPAASPTPTRRPAPTRTPLATPLPSVEVNGTEQPTERRLVFGDGPVILDLRTGTLQSFGNSYEDVVWADDDTLVCVCVVRVSGVSPPTAIALRFGRFDQSGQRLVERDLVTLEEMVAVADMTEGFNVAATMDAAGGRMFVVAVVRRPPVWTVELHVVDAEAGDLLDSVVIDTVPVDLDEARPTASPRINGSVPDGVYAWANMVAAAPDGESVLVTVAFSEVRGDQWLNRIAEWFVPIRDGKPGEPMPVPAEASLVPDRWCLGRPTFVDSELVAQVCGPATTPQIGASFWSVRRLTTAGASLGDWPIGAVGAGGSAATSLVDRERRVVYLWDPFRHLVSRVEIDTGRTSEAVVEDSALTGDRDPSNRGWVGVEPGLVRSVDGTRLYAAGLRTATGNAARSTGIWVFDAETLEVLDHWQPRALLTSLAVSGDGRFVYAAGAAGYDVDGNENHQWRASLTVYNATTGEIAVLYGSIGEGQWIGFPAAF